MEAVSRRQLARLHALGVGARRAGEGGQHLALHQSKAVDISSKRRPRRKLLRVTSKAQHEMNNENSKHNKVRWFKGWRKNPSFIIINNGEWDLEPESLQVVSLLFQVSMSPLNVFKPLVQLKMHE